MTTKPKAGTGTAAAEANRAQAFVIVGNFQPGEVIRIVVISPEQAKQLPTLPDDALQIAIAPAGGL